MIDKSLRLTLLPAELIIKNFVIGEKQCNYEQYLLEFVNKSPFFLSKSNGLSYTSPTSEACGECDCNSPNYKIDFKLIASKTILQARSLFSKGKVSLYNGGMVMRTSPRKEKGSMKGTQLHAVLREYDCEKLFLLRKSKPQKQCIENDVCELLETLETNKNLLLFFPYSFQFDTEYEFNLGVKQIQEALNNDFQCTIEYRHRVAGEFDTYISFIYDNHIVFMEKRNNMFVFVDSVKLSESPVYIRLLEYTHIF